jgi:superfamily I DNA/RNA helicase
MPTLLEQVYERIFSDLTQEQQSVVYAKGRAVVIACPGSGKTRCVAYRLARHLADLTTKNTGIAVLSFTNIAVKEIASRLENLGLGYPLSDRHFLGTFDSFLTHQLFKPYGHLVMGCNSAPEIVAVEQKSILDQFMPPDAKTISLGRGRMPKLVNLADVRFLPMFFIN